MLTSVNQGLDEINFDFDAAENGINQVICKWIFSFEYFKCDQDVQEKFQPYWDLVSISKL